MAREERERAILKLLADSSLALPPKTIYINLKLQGATFSERTVHRLLSSLSERGLVENPPRRMIITGILGMASRFSTNNEPGRAFRRRANKPL